MLLCLPVGTVSAWGGSIAYARRQASHRRNGAVGRACRRGPAVHRRRASSRRLFGGFVARMPEYRFNFGRMGRRRPTTAARARTTTAATRQDYGTYRTLCVRTCDGFYFPISDGVRRERLYSDTPPVLAALRWRGAAVLLPDHGRQPRDDGRPRRATATPTCRTRSATARRSSMPARASRRRGRQESAARHERYAGRGGAARSGSMPTDGWRSTAQAQASREASRGPSPYDSEPSRAYGRGPQSPWDRPQDRARERPQERAQDRGGDGREPRPAYGWDHD